jgi:uncharacterized protein (TIGR02145 family)
MKKFLLTLPLLVSFLLATTQNFYCGSSTLTDIDGNVYNTVLMGSRCWTKENMRTMHYANGETAGIPINKTGFRESVNMHGKLQVYLNQGKAGNVTIETYNTEGEKVWSSVIWCGSGSNMLEFTIGPAGFYLVNLSSETMKSTFKVLGAYQSLMSVKSVPAIQDDHAKSAVLVPNPRFIYDYDNDPVNGEKFGKLYTVASALNVEIPVDAPVTLDNVIQGICPEGWHVSNDTDWTQLQLAIGMTEMEIQNEWIRPEGTRGRALRSPDTTYWFSANGTDEYGFSAKGAGWYSYPRFILLKEYAIWLSHAQSSLLLMNVDNGSLGIMKDWANARNGDAYSVRCVQNY